MSEGASVPGPKRDALEGASAAKPSEGAPKASEAGASDDAEIVTNSLSGEELDALLHKSRGRLMTLDGVTAELTGDEIEQLLRDVQDDFERRSEAENEAPTVPGLPEPEEPPKPEPESAMPLIADEVTPDADGFARQEAIATRPMVPTGRPPKVALARMAPPVAVPARKRLPSTPPEAPEARSDLKSPLVWPAPKLDAVEAAPSIEARQTPKPRTPSLSEIAFESSRRSPVVKILVAAAAFAVVAFVLVRLATDDDEPAPLAASSAAPHGPQLTAPPSQPHSDTRPAAPSAAESPAERDAKAALTRLRDGLKECVKRTAMILPGSSPAIPATLKSTSGEGYKPGFSDFKTPVWSCSHFNAEGPMRFQLQWQLSRGGSDGIGIAWIDRDGDGRADRAFAFRASLKQRGQMEASEVTPTDANRPVVAVTY